METTLEVTTRTTIGKGHARQSRGAGKVPAVVYGPITAPISVEIDPAALMNMFKATGDKNTIVNVQVGGSVHPCLVLEVQRHPLSREVLHVDFYAVPQDREIEVMLPLNPVGKPKGASLGGRVRLIRREVKARCVFSKIPARLDVDVTPLDIGDRIKASEVVMPDGVSLVFDTDYNVLELYGKKQKGAK